MDKKGEVFVKDSVLLFDEFEAYDKSDVGKESKKMGYKPDSTHSKLAMFLLEEKLKAKILIGIRILKLFQKITMIIRITMERSLRVKRDDWVDVM